MLVQPGSTKLGPSMPFVKVETELQCLWQMQVSSPLCKWAAPIVPVLKRMVQYVCGGDYKLTANKALLTESYPLPNVDEMVTALAGGMSFTKLDMSNAYLQLPVDEESQEYLVIKGSI